MSVNLLTGYAPSFFNTSYQTWFSQNIFGPSISIYPNYATPSLLAFSNKMNPSFVASAVIYFANVNDIAGFAFDVMSNSTTNTTTYNLVSVQFTSIGTTSNTFQISFSHFNGISLTSYLFATASSSWSGSYDYPSIALRIIRIGVYVGIYINNSLLNFNQMSVLGEQVSIPPFLPTSYFVLDGIIPFTDSIGLYINGQGTSGGVSPFDRIDFTNIQIFDLARNVSLDYFMNDVSALGGIMKYNGQQQFSDNFTNLNNWQ